MIRSFQEYVKILSGFDSNPCYHRLWKLRFLCCVVAAAFCLPTYHAIAQTSESESFELVQVGDIIQFNRGKRFALVIKVNGRDIVVKESFAGRYREKEVSARDKWKIFLSSDQIAGTLNPMRSKLRIWTSKSGTYTIAAKLLDIQVDAVQLKKKDGSLVTVPLAKLSEADQNYVRKKKKYISQKKNESENPFGEGANEKGDAANEYPAEVRRLLSNRSRLLKPEKKKVVPEFRVNLRKAKSIYVQTDQWKDVSFRQSNLDFQSWTSFMVPIPGLPLAPKIKSVNYSYSSRIAACLFSSAAENRFMALSLIDLRNQKLIAHGFIPGREIEDTFVSGRASTRINDLKPDGSMVMTSQTWNRDQVKLEVWKKDGRQLKSIASSVLSRAIGTDFSAYFVSETEGVLVAKNGLVVLFEIKDHIYPTHVYSVQKDSHQKMIFRITPDRKTLLVYLLDKRQVVAINTTEKRIVGILNTDHNQKINAISFGDDSQSFFLWGNMEKMKFNLNNGKLISSLSYNHQNRGWGQKFLAVDEKTVIRDGKIYQSKIGKEVGLIRNHYVDHSRILHYAKGHRIVASVESGNVNRRNVHPVHELPGERTFAGILKLQRQILPIDKISTKVSKLSEKDLIIFGKGSTVQLSFKLGKQKDAQKKIEEKIIADFKKNGIRIVEKGAEFQMVISYRQKEQQKQIYEIIDGIRPFHGHLHLGPGRRFDPRRYKEVSIVPKFLSAVLKSNDITIWSKKTSAHLKSPILTVRDLDRIIARSDRMKAKDMAKWKFPTERIIFNSDNGINQRWITK